MRTSRIRFLTLLTVVAAAVSAVWLSVADGEGVPPVPRVPTPWVR
jgi:hypothetical protein